MSPPSPPPPNRKHASSLSQSWSTPNLHHLDASSPAITIDSVTPRSSKDSAGLSSPLSPKSRTGLPSPPSSRDGFEPEEEEDEDRVDFQLGDDDPALDSDGNLLPSDDSFASSSDSGRSSLGPPGSPPAPATSVQLGRSHSLASFAPPFYNRPPLPLPPSPSLTSLLRPSSFSATPSRPTTPDESENEGQGDAEMHASARAATAVPRAAPKVPTYEYYGFVLYLTSSAVMVMYVLWSFLPSPFLHALGIDYYPNRWWSLALPAHLVASLVYIYVALACYNTEVLTLPLTHPGCFVDEAAHVAVLDARGRIAREDRTLGRDEPKRRTNAGKEKERGKSGRKKEQDREKKRLARSQAYPSPAAEWDWRAVWSEGTDAVMDVPIGGVCEILYGN